MGQELLSVFSSMRIQDGFDIVIVAVMISVLLIWFKGRASRFVFFGVGLVMAVYLAARFFQLYLTTLALQGFFAILLFILVVIFQEDLRRFFERLAILSRIGKEGGGSDTFYAQEMEILAATAVNLAKNHVGALIVVKGNDPLDRHISGGTPLDGLPSQPLLESLFDPRTPGHDGAVIIDSGRIVRFGCHLPLSGNAEAYGIDGLRHTAALGLAERSDALCIVVSEERGVISVARNGVITDPLQAAALRNILDAFYSEKAPPKRANLFVRWFQKNTREKAIAVVLACTLWFVFGYQKETIRRDYVVPIEYLNVARHVIIAEPKTIEARVVLTGPPQAFQLWASENLKLSLNLADIGEGRHEIVLTKEMVKVPSNLAVVAIQPQEITVTAYRLVPVEVPVVVLTKNRPPRGVSIQEIVAVPATVQVLAPSHTTAERLTIHTEEIDLSMVPEGGATLEPAVRYPSSVQFETGKAPVIQVVIRSSKVIDVP